MAKPDPSRKRAGCWRFLAWSLALCVAAAAVLGILLYTGIPQRLGAQALLSSQLNAEANVASVSLRNPLAVQGLTLASGAASVYGPVLKVGRAALRYDLLPDNGRYLRSLDLADIRISLQQGADENNFQFLLDQFAQPGDAGGGDSTPWIPERVAVKDLWVELNFPSYYLRMDGLGFDAALAGAAEGALALQAPETGIAWTSVYTPGGQQAGAGAVAFDAAWKGGDVDVEATIDLGALARIRGTLSLMQRDGSTFFALSLPEASLEDPLWSAALTDFSPVPVRFDRLSLSDSEIHLHEADGQWVVDQAAVDATVPALSVGPEEAPYYSGPLKLAVHGNYGDATTIAGEITLLDDAHLNGTFQWTPDGLEGAFQWPLWSRGSLAQLVPPDYAFVLDLLKPLKALGAQGTLVQAPEALQIEGALSGDFGAENPLSAPLSLSYSNAPDTGLSLKSDIALEGGSVHSNVTLLPDMPLTVDNVLEKVQVNPWAAYLLGEPLVPWFSGGLSGTANIVMPAGQPLELDLDLSGEALRYGDLALPTGEPVRLMGKLTYDLATGTLASKDAHLQQEGVVDLNTKAWSLDLNTTAMRLALDSTLSLDAVAALFGLSDLYGNAAIAGQLSVGPEATTLNEFTATSEDLGYGDYSVPYGSALSLAGSLAYARGPNTLSFAPLAVAIGEGTHLTSGALVFGLPGEQTAFTMRATPFVLETDLDILVQRGLLGGVTGGAATVRSDDFGWNGASYAGVLAWDFAAERIDMPDDMATLENIAWSGRYNPGDEEDGGGRLTASAFAIYKIPFGAADTHLKVTPEHVVCDSLETTFLGGNLSLSGKIDYHDPAFPGIVKVSVSELDLEEFTRAFEPPDVVLTGKVNGTADLALSMDGLQDLNVDMTASEGLTLNRTTVREILMSQYVNDAVGSKSVQKVIEKVIGKDEQRPFEKAVLQLRLEDGLIRGIARLESESLDVTVDINAEPKAILEAIRSTTEDL